MNKDFGSYRASLEFNLGVTYIRQKKYTEARTVLKMLSKTTTHTRAPIFCFRMSLAVPSTRSLPFWPQPVSFRWNSNTANGTAVGIITEVLKPAAKDPKTGNINIFMDLNAPKDEGDFGIFDLLLGTLTTVRGDDDKGKSDNQMFIEAIGSVIAILAEDKKMQKTFIGKNYVPFMSDLKKNGHIDALGNMVLYIRDNKNADAAKWVAANDANLSAFLKLGKRVPIAGKIMIGFAKLPRLSQDRLLPQVVFICLLAAICPPALPPRRQTCLQHDRRSRGKEGDQGTSREY